jgi:hypothetical protein
VQILSGDIIMAILAGGLAMRRYMELTGINEPGSLGEGKTKKH